MKKFNRTQHLLFTLLIALPCLSFGQGSGGSAGSAGSSSSTGATGSSTNSLAGTSAAGTISTGVRVDTNTQGVTNPGVTSVGVSGAAMGSTAVAGEATSEQIRTSNFQLRDSLANAVQSRLETSHQDITANSSRLGQMSGDTRTRYQAALQRAQQREVAVRNSLAAVRSADASNYEAARNRLAQDYDAYVTAVAELETSGVSSIPR